MTTFRLDRRHLIPRRACISCHHRMACLGLLYIQLSASTSLTSPRSAMSASLRRRASVSRRFSSFSTVSSATNQACVRVRVGNAGERGFFGSVDRRGHRVSDARRTSWVWRTDRSGRRVSRRQNARVRRVRFKETLGGREICRIRTTGDETHRRGVVVHDVPPLAGGFRRRPPRDADPAGASEKSRHGRRRGRHRVERNVERASRGLFFYR